MLRWSYAELLTQKDLQITTKVSFPWKRMNGQLHREYITDIHLTEHPLVSN